MSTAYQVLARKYRPKTFDEIVGQGHVVQTLKNAISTGRIAHAFLFVGPRGIGKTSTARILAKALNCPGGPKINFNPDDPICKEIAEGRSLDVIEIDGASNNSVDNIRELRDNVPYAPVSGKYKIYIIDEVHMLSASAFNALLKTLEEPPAHVIFIFATTDVHKVLPTILSRCQRFDLRCISDADIAKHLEKIAKLENIQADSQALRIIARMADGGMRDAESTFDQLISFCGNKITEEDVLNIFGLTSVAGVRELAQAILSSQADAALKKTRELAQTDKDLTSLTQDLLRYFRNLLIFQLSPDIAKQELSEEELQYFTGITPPAQSLCMSLLDELTHLENRLKFTLVKDAVFEVAILRMLEQHQRVSLEEILKKLVQAGATTTSMHEYKPVSSVAPAASAIFTPQPVVEKPAVQISVPVSEPKPAPQEPVSKTFFQMPIVSETKAPATSSPAQAAPKESLAARLAQVQPVVEPEIPLVPQASQSASVEKSSHKKESKVEFDKASYQNDPLIKAAVKAFEGRLIEIRAAKT